MLRRKPIDQLTHPGSGLHRSLGVGHLTMISIGATLGTGIFVVLGGAKGGARTNTILVWVKIGALAGMSAGAATLFFSYIGFDAASTAGEEAKNPQRDLPRAIILSLVVITALYCAVALGAVVATTSVVLTVLYGQTRILYAMSRDGLVPSIFAKPSPKTGVPFAPVTPLLGLGFCVYMMFSLGLDTWIAFLAWMVLGFVIYFSYSVRKASLEVPGDH